MFKVLGCLSTQHDPWLVGLAAIICLVSSISAIHVWWKSLETQTTSKPLWLFLASSACGLGIWATHFIAMLAYSPGIQVGFDPTLVLCSLFIAVIFTSIALSVVAARPGWTGYITGGAMMGLAVTCMHYLGAEALSLPGHIEWDGNLVGVSIGIGIVAAAGGLWAASRGRQLKHLVTAGLLLSLAVVGLHFTGMGAMSIVIDPRIVPQGLVFSSRDMALTISGTVSVVLGISLTSSLMAHHTKTAIVQSERKFLGLIEGIRDCSICMLDTRGRVMTWNHAAEILEEYTAEEAIGLHIRAFHTPRDQMEGQPEAMLEQASRDGRVEVETYQVRRGGQRFWGLISLEASYATDGSLDGFIRTIRDHSARREAQEKELLARHNLDLTLAHMSHGICLFDKDERIVCVNRRFPEVLGSDPRLSAIGTSFMDLLTQLTAHRHEYRVAQHEAQEIYHIHRDEIAAGRVSTTTIATADSRSIAISFSPVGDGSWVMTCEDVTIRQQSERKIAHMARHDVLTELPNRLLFTEHLERELAKAGSFGSQVAVLCMDLNRFKEVNDQHGHATGDLLLKTLADRMRAILQPDEFIARIGGDEFIAVKPIQNRSEVADFVRRLEREVYLPVPTSGGDLAATGSIGIAIFPEDADDAEKLMSNADLAMYRAKASRLGTAVCYFETGMDEIARRRRQIAAELWVALEREEFAVHYQVQKSVETGDITGYEALVRWIHPERGMIMPTQFISVAEDCGVILKLGEWVLRRACQDAVHGLGGHKVAVNLSPVQLGHPDLVALVTSILEETGLPASRLELEITESVIISDKQRALATLRAIKALGISIAIDDFGVGYSSLDTLNAFPFDKIKIDRSFLQAAEERTEAKAIVRAILALGRSLGINVLAEGVENEVQLRLLRQEGCVEGQGYLFGRPIEIAASTLEYATVSVA